MPDLDLDARLDELFATDPKEFTATRDALARDLKAADRADEAADVKALRKPTVAVAAVNRTARERVDQVAALVELGEELAALQADAQGDRDELRDLARQRRTLLHQLTEYAGGHDRATRRRPLRHRGHARRRVARRGPPRRPAARPAHPGALPGGALRARRRRRSVTAGGASSQYQGDTRTAAPPRDELAARRARAELETARERAEEAEESVREHTEAATEATERLEAAHRHIADLEADLADARAELADLKRTERDAQRAERRARTEQERIASALHAAERAVDDST